MTRDPKFAAPEFRPGRRDGWTRLDRESLRERAQAKHVQEFHDAEWDCRVIVTPEGTFFALGGAA